MKYKGITKIILFCFLFNIAASGQLSAGGIGEMRKDMEAQIRESDKKDIFEARLTDALTQKDDEKLTKLLQFSKEYPDSKFAGDAYFAATFISFSNALAGEDNRLILKSTKDIVDFIAGDPDSQFKKIAYSKIVEAVGAAQAAKYDALRIPYKYIPYYVNGMVSLKFRGWQAAVENFSVLENALGESRDCKGAFEFDIYPALATAYMGLGRVKDAKTIAAKALKKFPQDEWFIQFMERLKEKKAR